MSFFEKIKNLFKSASASNKTDELPDNNIVVGKIIKCEKHPNADRLKVCTVDCGTEIRTIVCGGTNVRDNMLVIVAKPGAKVRFGGAGDQTELTSTVIRGVLSDGMLCGAEEIGLSEKFPPKGEKEIVDISHLNIAPGSALSAVMTK